MFSLLVIVFSYANTWTEFLTKRYGFNYTSNQIGFAIGGQTTTELISQLQTYKTNVGTFDSNALYMVFMGPSDWADSTNGEGVGRRSYANEIEFPIDTRDNRVPYVNDLRGKLKNGTITFSEVFPQTSNDIDIRATNMKNFIQILHNNGVQYIVVLNNFNTSLRANTSTNNFLSSENGAFFDGIWNDQFNQAIYKKINELTSNVNVIFIDNNRFITEFTSDPARYLPQNTIVGTFKNNGFFDLAYHPTLAAQKILSQYIASIIESPTRIALVRELPLERGSKDFQNTRKLAESLILEQSEKPFSIDFISDYSHSYTTSFTKKQLGFKSGNTINGEIFLITKLQII